MPVLAKFCGIVIRLLKLDIVGNRIHAFHGDEEMVVDLSDLRVVSGGLSNGASGMVLAWARQHRQEILWGIRELGRVRA